MINTLLFEILLFVLTILSPDIDKARIEMTAKKNVLAVDFTKLNGSDENNKEITYEVTISFPEGEGAEEIIYQMIDNGNYMCNLKNENSFELNVDHLHSQLDPDKITSKRQKLTDSNKNPLIIKPGKEFIEIYSPKEKITFRIPVKFFK